MSKVIGAVLAATGFLACPCHLLITLPLLVGLLGGTAAGAFLAANTGVVILAASVYFIGGLGLGWYLLMRPTQSPVNAAGLSSSAACCLPAFDGGSDSQPAARGQTVRDEPALRARY